MNAPTTAAALAEPTLQTININKLRPSTTHIQELRRARFDKKALDELADSIRKVGLLQPIVAVPFKKSPLLNPVESDPTHVIVAGERRWLAARAAGLTQVPVSVRELTDEQILEVQLIENLQREGLHELEEAEGYDELMKLKKINADAVAGMVGKSRSYVYGRTKLLALAPEARKAFYAGDMDASTALLVARIPGEELQRRALKELDEAREYGDVQNYKDAARLLRQQFMLDLKSAPFKIEDLTLLPKAGSCTACPKRTGNQKELFADVKDADVCTDPACFAEKRSAAEARTIAEYKAKGITVIAGEQAKQILRHGDHYATGGYQLAGEVSYEDPKRRKVAAVVGEKAVQLVQSPHSGKLIRVVHGSAVAEALKAQGIKTERQKQAERAAKDRAEQATRPDAETFAAEILRRIHDKLNGELSKPLMQQVLIELLVEADGMLTGENLNLLEKLWGLKAHTLNANNYTLPKACATWDAKKLGKLAIETIALVDIMESSGDRADAICAALKIDPKQVEKDLAAKLKKGPEPKAAAPKKKGKK